MFTLRNNPIGIYEKAIPNQYDWEDKIKIAKSAGFDFIEISIDEGDERLSRLNWSESKKKEIKDILENYDFDIRSMCLSGHRRFPFGSKDEKSRKEAYEIMDKAISFARDIGIRNIQLAGYDVYYEPSDDYTRDLFIEGLKYAAKAAEKENIMLSIEIMDTPFIGTITKGIEFIEIINSPYLQLYPDLGNLSQWAEDPEDELEKGIKHIVAIHLKDTKPGVFKCVPFGEGTVRFHDLFIKLKHLEYNGPFLIEMWADNNRKYGLDESIRILKEAKEWVYERMG